MAARVLAPERPGHWLDPGPLGCLGVGAPFALAAKKMYPDKKVLVLSGDGSFGLNGFDFETCVRFKLPVTCVVANDAAWGQIRGPQVMIFGAERAPATKLAPTRYDKVVEAFGGRGYHVEDPTRLTATIKEALNSGETSCVNVPIDPEFVQPYRRVEIECLTVRGHRVKRSAMNRAPLVALACFLAVGCDDKKDAAPAAPASGAAAVPASGPPPLRLLAPPPRRPRAPPPSAASGDKGEVTGTVVVTGKVPAMDDLKRNSDAFCAKKQMKDESVVAGKKGELANVVVHINGLPATPPPSDKAALTQEDCMYRPRVQGVVDGQKLEIRNGDPVLHNVHTYEGARTLFNVAQVPGTPNIEKTFTQNGVMLKFKCDVHQWMTGFVWVQNNSYFAVTGADGKFDIKDVPVGTWDIEAWHERFGTKTGKITVAKGKPAEIKFEFVGTETAAAK